ncbi:hypothetical protein B0H11DRAFT_953561 [Mycena galericulata]|nr:hypothetical protein B0H11DRAFT_953561 [Mycena galericulata]
MQRDAGKKHCSFANFRSISPEVAADFVVSAIGDAGPDVRLRYCARCLYGAMHVVYPKDTVEAVSDFTRDAEVADEGVADVKPQFRMQTLQRKHFHAFWTAVVRFLSVIRNDTQQIRFMFDFAGCKCFAATPPNPHIAEFHRIGAVLYPQYKNRDEQFVAICIHKLVSALNDCLAMANSVKVAQNSRNSRWPRSTKDILPYGGLIATKAFVSWAYYTEDMAFTAFGILGHMVKICGTLIIGNIVANPDIGEAFILTGLRMCRAGAMTLGDRPHADYSDQLASAAEFRQRATFAAAFLRSATDLAPEIFVVLLKTRETKMLQLLSLILEVCNVYSVYADPELDAEFKSVDWSIFSTLAKRILADYPELQPRLGKLHWAITMDQRAIEDPLHAVHRVLVAAKSRTCCHAAGCPHSLATTGQEYKRCSACRVAAYCSKSCQTLAWKTGPHAHKRICDKIKLLLAKGGGLDDRDAFVRNCREAQVSADEAMEVAKWEFNPSVTVSDLERRVDTDGAADFDEVYWRLHPDKHPQYAERMEKIFKMRGIS